MDPDDFFNIKDLTRLKTGLTAEGIGILEDKENKFGQALQKFNENRSQYATEKIKNETNENPETPIDTATENEDIIFLQKAIKILAEKYELDSQGIFEYIKEVVDVSLGSDRREKIWKKLEGETNHSTRYIRCLVLNVDNQKYLIDVDKKELRLFDEKEFEKRDPNFIRYKALKRGDYDYYDGT